MKTHRSLTVIPDYTVDEFVVYTLGLTNLVSSDQNRDPLAVHGKRIHTNPMQMELMEVEGSMSYRQIAAALDAEGKRPADYGELKGYWMDSPPNDRPVVIIPSKDDLQVGVWFCGKDEKTPLALVIIKTTESDANFATTTLKEDHPFDQTYLFLVTEK